MLYVICYMLYVILSQILNIMNSSEISEHLNKLTEHSKQALIDKFYNFPVLPPQQQLQGQRQQQVLKKYFPWGCSKINQPPFFSSQDCIADARISDCTNICISIKYGICPFFTPESLKYIQHRLRQAKQVGGNLYVKLIQSRDGEIRHDNVMALARVTEVNPFLTFRFWHIRPGKNYPIGVAKIEIVCVGYIKNYERSSPKRVYEELKDSQLEWKFLRAADNIQQVERHKYINAIKENKCQKLQQELKQKNLSMLDLFNTS